MRVACEVRRQCDAAIMNPIDNIANLLAVVGGWVATAESGADRSLANAPVGCVIVSAFCWELSVKTLQTSDVCINSIGVNVGGIGLGSNCANHHGDGEKGLCEHV